MDSMTTPLLPASSSSSSSSASSPLTHAWAHDVFLSFRGEDARFNFTDHLYNSLILKGIRAFKDNEQLRRGEEISQQTIYKQIEDSRISVVILCENYASSSWCLDELAHILQCTETKGQIVIPVFYKVDPSHVRYQTGSYAEAFEGHQSRLKDNMLRWRTALKEVANLSGFAFDDHGDEHEFIQNIVKAISQILNRAYLDVAPYLVGNESRVHDIIKLLGSGVNDVRCIGIWGSGGIGKTTLAKDVYSSIAHKFEGSCFLENVRGNSVERGGLVQQQNILLSQITRDAMPKVITNVDKGINMIKKRLRHKRVLLILDDVNELDQLKKLAGGHDWFGVGSRIIIATRDKNVLKAHQVDEMYDVKELDHSESVELLRWNAFPGKRIPDDYVELANAIVGYAKGNPFVVKFIGSFLRCKSIDEWQAVLDSYNRADQHNLQESDPVNIASCN